MNGPDWKGLKAEIEDAKYASLSDSELLEIFNRKEDEQEQSLSQKHGFPEITEHDLLHVRSAPWIKYFSADGQEVGEKDEWAHIQEGGVE